MEIYCEGKNYKLYKGKMEEVLPTLPSNSIDSVVCDPPYDLTSNNSSKGFMNKEWDGTGVAFKKKTWEHCLRVLKPGGYLLAFGGTRTYHRMACAIEDAGFEIRDTIMWIYGSGFPKSMSLGKVIEGKQVLGSANVRDIKKLDGKKETVTGGWNSNEVEQGKRKKEYEQVKTYVNYQTELGKFWNGWGTSLKPAYEPIIVARKPVEGTIADNVLKYGVGGINIDECRVETDDYYHMDAKKTPCAEGYQRKNKSMFTDKNESEMNPNGRFPANVILTYDDTDYDEVCGGFPQSKGACSQSNYSNGKIYRGQSLQESSTKLDCFREWYNDDGSAARYFYAAKASKKDRDDGMDLFATNKVNDGRKTLIDNAFQRGETQRRNIHPTVKPTELMQYLIRLVTPKGGAILDPFNGSGSTGKAAMFENRERNANYTYIGVEMTDEYLPISKARIEYAINQYEYEQKKEEKETGQISIFDFI